MHELGIFAWRVFRMVRTGFSFKVALNQAWVCWRHNKLVKCMYVVFFGIGVLYAIASIAYPA